VQSIDSFCGESLETKNQPERPAVQLNGINSSFAGNELQMLEKLNEKIDRLPPKLFLFEGVDLEFAIFFCKLCATLTN